MPTDLHCLQTFVALDFETTGLSPSQSDVIDVGAIRYENGMEVARMDTLVYTESAILPEVVQLTGIAQQELQGAPTANSVFPELQEFIGTAPVMAHNAAFELSFLRKYLGTSYSPIMMDTMDVLPLVFPLEHSYGLEHFIRKAGIRDHELHRGLQDALDMVEVVRFCERELSKPHHATTCTVVEKHMQGVVAWPWKPLFADKHSYSESALDLVDFRDEFSDDKPTSLFGIPDNLHQRLDQEEVFKPHWPSYKVRHQQISMAKRAGEVLCEGGSFVCEAGTGTGKTLAYTTAALSSLAQDSNTPIVVSTNTRMLQDQFLHQEVPRLKNLLRRNDLQAISVKGMNNYVCVRKILQDSSSGARLFSDDQAQEAWGRTFLHLWLLHTPDGEVDTLPMALRAMNPVIGKAYAVARADFRDCDKQECEFFSNCFFFRKRWQAQQSHLVITNHSFLLSWPQWMPDYHRLVVDEADEFADEAVDACSRAASNEGLHDAIDFSIREKGACTKWFQEAMKSRVDNEGAAYLSGVLEANFVSVNRLHEQIHAMQQLLLPLKGDVFTKHITMDDETLNARLSQEIFLVAENIMQLLQDALQKNLKAMDIIAGFFDEKSALPEVHKRANASLQALSMQADAIDLFLQQNDKEYAHYIAIGNEQWELISSPYDIGQQLYQQLYSRLSAIVCTSATLTATQRLQDFVYRTGIHLMEGDADLERYNSPFDYRKQSKLLFLKGFPSFLSDRFVSDTARFVFDVADLLGGKVLVLFTSRDRMERVHAELQPRVNKSPFKLITHGKTHNSISRCVDQFKNSNSAILMGARGMWKGVDIPGEALQCVILEKMPYAVPHPYTKGLQEQVTSKLREQAWEQGEEPDERRLGQLAWNQVDKPLMFQAFRQMFGRLIRTESDLGAMIVLDPQLRGNYLSARHKELVGLLGGTRAEIVHADNIVPSLQFLLPTFT